MGHRKKRIGWAVSVGNSTGNADWYSAIVPKLIKEFSFVRFFTPFFYIKMAVPTLAHFKLPVIDNEPMVGDLIGMDIVVTSFDHREAMVLGPTIERN